MYDDRKQDYTEVQSLALWQLIIDHEGTTFRTTGRGSRPGVEFTYEVSRTSRTAGRHYSGQSIPGYGNELWIVTAEGERKKNSISRSTVDRAYRTALEEQERSGFVSGPRKLGVPGVRSNLYAMFLRFELIKDTPDDAAMIKSRTETVNSAESKADCRK